METLEPIVIDQQTFLKDHFVLPPLPESVLKIQEIINTSDVNVESISELLRKEPVLTVHVLKIVNSAYYGFRREIDDIKFAVAYLGIREIYNIVLSVAVVKTMGVDELEELERFWTHAIFTALCAKHIARIYEPLLSPEPIWLGVLLHDIGKLVFMRFFPEHYMAVAEHSRKNGCLFSDSEKQLAVPESAYMGGILCDHWRLPTSVRDACECHNMYGLENLGNGSRADFRKIMCAANLMASLASEELTYEIKQSIFNKLSECFGCDEKEFLKLMGEIYDLKIEVAKFKW